MECALCKTEFKCQNSLACWCNDLPQLVHLTVSNNCYCPECLIELLAVQFNAQRIVSSADKIKIAKLGIPENPIEGVDFIINASGLYTFTSWYLLRRGYCCENGCLNCPYNYKKEN